MTASVSKMSVPFVVAATLSPPSTKTTTTTTTPGYRLPILFILINFDNFFIFKQSFFVFQYCYQSCLKNNKWSSMVPAFSISSLQYGCVCWIFSLPASSMSYVLSVRLGKKHQHWMWHMCMPWSVRC